MKKLKFSSNFFDCFNEEWFFGLSIEGISQRETIDFLEQATSGTSNEGILQQVTSAFFQWPTSDFLQRATSEFHNE